MCRYVVEAITDHAIDEKVGDRVYKGEYGGSLDYTGKSVLRGQVGRFREEIRSDYGA
jgi:hypothetical protein